MYELYFFISSLLLLVVLVLSKRGELSSGVQGTVGSMLSHLDTKSTKILRDLGVIGSWLLTGVRTVFLVHLPEKSRVTYNEARESMLREYNKHKDVVMGKKEMKQNGGSFFLKRIKQEIGVEKGKIE